MKRKCLILALVLISCILFLKIGYQKQAKSEKEPLASQTKPEAAPEPNKPSPRMTFDNMVYDFGEVDPNRKNTGQIKFTNTGDALLKITKVDRGSGVITNLEKMEYEPGESGTLKVEWNSGSRPSKLNKKLTIHSNDPKTPETSLSLMAKIVLQVDWEPKRLKLFLDEENAGCSKITISSVDNQPFSITDFKSTGDSITADYDPSEKATKYDLEPKVDIEKLQKSLKGRIDISLDHPKGNAAVILFSVLPKYTVNPPLLIIFNAEPNKPIVRKISVLKNYGKEFEIESVSSKNDIVAMKLLEQKKIRNGYQLDIEITPPAADGKPRFTDEFSLKIKDDENLTIRCNGYYSKIKPKPEVQ